MGLIHTALVVSDIDATLDFYADLGLERTNEFELDDARDVYVDSDDTNMELQFKYDPTSATRVEPAGTDHVAVEVADADRVFEDIVEAQSLDIVKPPVDIDPVNACVAFVKDPDGYVVEFVSIEDRTHPRYRLVSAANSRRRRRSARPTGSPRRIGICCQNVNTKLLCLRTQPRC